MGAVCGSAQVQADENVLGRNERSLKYLYNLYTPNQLKVVYESFCNMDSQHTGIIRYDEFFAHCKIEKSAINMKIFTLLSTDENSNNGKLCFIEFCVLLWNF
jgi:hypothetical protein